MKSIIKKSLLVLCALMIIVSLAACGGTAPAATDAPADVTEAPAPAATEAPEAEATAAPEADTATGILGSWEYEYGGFVYTFNEDGTGTYDAAGTMMNFTYEDDGTSISFLYDGNTDPMVLEYELDGDTLNIKDSIGNDTIYKRK